MNQTAYDAGFKLGQTIGFVVVVLLIVLLIAVLAWASIVVSRHLKRYHVRKEG